MAISKTKILQTIKSLDCLYNQTSDTNLKTYYSKLALLELCGWIELAMDDIILCCLRRCLKNQDYIKHVKSEVKKNSAFDYENNFRNLLIKVVGLMNFEKLERKINPLSLVTLKATLDKLKPLRNSHAHTYLKGCTQVLNAPSVTKGDFIVVFNALKDYERTLKKLKL